MTSLDDRLLGERRDNYVSSDEEQEEENDVGSLQKCEPEPQGCTGSAYSTSKTGPKGVLEDYKRYKEIQKRERIEEKKEVNNYIKKNAMTCQSAREDEDEVEISDDDTFLREYHEKRIQQLKREAEQSILSQRARFGKVISITGDEFVDAIDKEDASVTVVMHLYENSVAACVQMNKCLDCLAQQYPQIKFCKLLASQAGLSLNFKLKALPTLQIYKDGMLLDNYICLADEFDDEFFAADVENFFIEKGVLSTNPMSGISKPIRGMKSGVSLDSDDDSDIGLD